MKKHVAVLMGGWSAEREVSLVSGKACALACEQLGYKVTVIDAQHDLAEQLVKVKPDVVFNALHGRWGEDGCIQGLLEVLEIPYTHSGVMASALAMDKPMAKKVFAGVGLPIVEGRVATKQEVMEGKVMAKPYVVKPINEGSSVGVKIIQEEENFFFDESNWHYGEQVLVERYIPGREIQVAVLDSKALGAVEVVIKNGFYDYEAKYTAGRAQHLMPAPVEKAVYEEVCELAERAHDALGCRGLTRSDFRYDDTQGGRGKFYLLEVNTQPGMTPLSLSPEIAQHVGINFNQLVDRLITGARLGA